MLEINTETLCRLIDLAEEFHAHQNVDTGDEPESIDDWDGELPEAVEENPFVEEFRSVMDGLNPDEQQQVVALMWLGRGDYELDEWDEALDYAAEAWTPTTADYLLAHPLLADHLTSGMEAFGLRCED